MTVRLWVYSEPGEAERVEEIAKAVGRVSPGREFDPVTGEYVLTWSYGHGKGVAKAAVDALALPYVTRVSITK
jgi:hypothetical protein